MENSARHNRLLGEHGIAYWIETGSRRVLFDTGQGMALVPNTDRLQIPLDQAEAVVLSHGHYDHTGGVADALRASLKAAVFAHPAAFERKYARDFDGTIRDIGIPESGIEAIRAGDHEIVDTASSTEVADGLFVTGEIPRVTDFEDTGGPFYSDPKCRHPDPLLDDQALYFDSNRGVVVLLGCAHAGVGNTLRRVRQLTGDTPIHAVIGGMHLGNASDERLGKTVDYFRELGTEVVAPAHCTGMAATIALSRAFPARLALCETGTVMEFEAP